ncbi:unnamed protein product [Chrysoparadoxa australica]
MRGRSPPPPPPAARPETPLTPFPPLTTHPHPVGGGGSLVLTFFPPFLFWVPMQKKSMSKRKRLEVENSYSGFKPPSSPCPAKVDVTHSDITPKQFFDEYVSKRRPVLLDGVLTDEGWRGSQWTIKHLAEKAGEASVRVEHRKDAEGRFGCGKEKTMRFGEFLEEMKKKNDLLYLSTQDLSVSIDGRPGIISPPLSLLKEDFPLRPSLMGGLIPQNINLWMGCTRHGAPASSGLHHDFHDNLYILVQGSKKFRLYSPADAGRMHTVGDMVSVHPNGLINYTGQPTRQDGSDMDAERALVAAEKLESAVEASKQDDSDVDEQAIMDAMDAVLDAEYGDAVEAEEGSSSDDEEEGLPDDAHATEATGMAKGGGSLGAPMPKNFSHIDLYRPAQEIEEQFPDFAGVACMEVEVKPGQMLFLPCGWFHEVSSESGDEGGVHQAINYWFHPPDSHSFERPYKSRFWEKDWTAREQDGFVEGLVCPGPQL